jgi:hypothetical protein
MHYKDTALYNGEAFICLVTITQVMKTVNSTETQHNIHGNKVWTFGNKYKNAET